MALRFRDMISLDFCMTISRCRFFSESSRRCSSTCQEERDMMGIKHQAHHAAGKERRQRPVTKLLTRQDCFHSHPSTHPMTSAAQGSDRPP